MNVHARRITPVTELPQPLSLLAYDILMMLGCTNKPVELLQLLDILKPVEAKWYKLGLRLGYAAGTLDAIRADNHHIVEDCMRDLLTQWRHNYPNKGWSDIVSALRGMGRDDVANDVEEKYLSSGMLDLHVHTCTLFQCFVQCQ